MATVELQFFTVNEVIGNLISSKVDDLNKNRKGNRWVYPTFPEDDVELPEAIVEVASVSYEPDSAGNYLYSETLDNGDHKEYFYKKAIYTVHVYPITGKRDEFEINDNGRQLYLSNKPLNIYLTSKIIDVTRKNRDQLMNYFDGFDEISVSPSFEDNKNQWASDITFEVKAKDLWVKEYHEGELTKSYSLAINIIS